MQRLPRPHHSPDDDAHDDNLMAQFLNPGVRRIPDAHEMAALAALQTSGDKLFAVGATFSTAVPNASNPPPTPAPWQPVHVLPLFTDAVVGWHISGGGEGTVTLDGQGSVVPA